MENKQIHQIQLHEFPISKSQSVDRIRVVLLFKFLVNDIDTLFALVVFNEHVIIVYRFNRTYTLNVEKKFLLNSVLFFSIYH